MDKGYWSSLRIVNRKHDLIGIRLYDPAEMTFPDLGVVKVRDPEKGESFWIDTSSNKDMEELKKQIESKYDQLNKNAKKIGFNLISISTNEDFVDPLLKLFKRREKR